MVLVLESPDLASSPWVAFEIAEARACGLGLAALNFGGAPMQAGIDPALRHWLSTTDLEVDHSIKLVALGAVRLPRGMPTGPSAWLHPPGVTRHG